MKTTLLLLASPIVALAAGCGGSTAAPPPAASAAAPDSAGWRRDIPEVGPAPALKAPLVNRKALKNGLAVLSVEKAPLPLVSLALVAHGGSAQDPAGLPGLAGFMGSMLKMGTEKLTASALADKAEALGASIDVDVDEDSMSITTTVLKENLEPLLALFADVVQHPKFDPKEVERVKKQRLGTLAQSEDVPRAAARNVFRRLVYGTHPYGHDALGEPTSVAKIGQKQLRDLYKEIFRPANAALVVVGDVTQAEAEHIAEQHFGTWKGKAGLALAPVLPQEKPPQVALVAKTQAPQSELLIGELAVARDDPDYYPLIMCNAILGGLFNSRINMNLREDKGYTYGARSYFDFMRTRGPFFVASGVRTDVTEPAIREVFKELDAIRTSDVSDEELKNAKARYGLSLPSLFQTTDAVLAQTAELYLYDLPLDYFQRLPDRINAVSVSDVRRVAEAHLHPDKMSVVVVGDDKVVAAGLDGLKRGDVQRLNYLGNPVNVPVVKH